MKNPYLYGYLPLISVVLFSLTFGVYAVTESIKLFKVIGVYSGMSQFMSDIEIRILLLIVFMLCFFMLFSALKLVGETIHELGMLFFAKELQVETYSNAKSASTIVFFGAIASAFGMSSLMLLALIFAATMIVYFMFVVYKMSDAMSTSGLVGLIMFEVLIWAASLVGIGYVIVRLYNTLLSSLPIS
ncbi:DUF5366 family protein [Caryophanon latum]|uniref:Uncharacterized protein n=1 Tax=Caryophanon latum TaxID=33977 RepID=A0A1C0YZR5_9BACL|nr:DUF5366 family protein [Caryophanon latum]OCS92586.1 hypothetical protein A6K76_06805 [Caryophanon latum]